MSLDDEKKELINTIGGPFLGRRHFRLVIMIKNVETETRRTTLS